MIVGLILGPLGEAQFRRAMSISQGDATVFSTRGLLLSILIVAALAVIIPLIPAVVARLRGGRQAGRLILGTDAD